MPKKEDSATSFNKAVQTFLILVHKVHAGRTARSENDLTSNLSRVLTALDLSTVIDTGQSRGRKRPDILAYVSQMDADLVLDADVVIESKKPEELEKHATFAAALIDPKFWKDKTFPYLMNNISKVQYFAITTFTEFVFLRVTPELRARLVEIARTGAAIDPATASLVATSTTSFQLEPKLPSADPRSAENWAAWMQTHLRAAAVAPIPFSQIRNSKGIRNRHDLEQFAEQLAEFASGSKDDRSSESGLFHSIRKSLPSDYRRLPPTVTHDLHLFLMTQHPGLGLGAVQKIARESSKSSMDDFVAASIHSLISRLFAFKAIEDIFCLGEAEPLLEKPLWIFGSTAFDNLSHEAVRALAFQRFRDIKKAANSVISHLATYGAFFDWIENTVDPVLFSSLLGLYSSHDLSSVEGDLLGRFFEIFAQKINKLRRRELGQYYTPAPVVRFMWHITTALAEQRTNPKDWSILDPAMGSGTFLCEGARNFGSKGVPKFWENLTGFDIAAQVIGIAHVNLYLSILSQLSREEVDQVGNIQLFVTDALDCDNGHYLSLILPLITEAADRDFIEQRIRISTEAKQHNKYTVVIGNPPYKNNSTLTLTQVADRFPRLFKTSKNNARAQERNMRDDYAWFFGAADYYIGKSGLISYVVSDSFARLFSYRYFRRDLLMHYHVRLIVRLGEGLFLDVGPRISFAIVLLEKREVPLTTPDGQVVPYADMRVLTGVDILGTEADPRFARMERIISDKEKIAPISHVPSIENNFSLYPTSDVLHRGTTNKVPIFGDKQEDRIFMQKWPGIITAFDELLKHTSKAELENRIRAFYAAANQRGKTAADDFKAVEAWGRVNGIDEESIPRLVAIALQVRQRAMTFDSGCVRKTINGAMPNEIRWYPPTSRVAYVYYEPTLDIPRNKFDGKSAGWGTMQQWREPRSHDITPKLVYTTATKPNYGLKAFVLHDEWCIKIHGGTSQQYNYTGLRSPLLSERAENDGLPNNLSDSGLRLLDVFSERGMPEDSMLFYIAGIYNSDFSAEFMEEGAGRGLGIAVPSTEQEIEAAVAIAHAGKCLRDMLWLFELVGSSTSVDAQLLEQHFQPELLLSLGLVKKEQTSKRFKVSATFEIAADLAVAISERQVELQAIIEKAVADLYA